MIRRSGRHRTLIPAIVGLTLLLPVVLAAQTDVPSLIPYPDRLLMLDGTFRIDNSARIVLPAGVSTEHQRLGDMVGRLIRETTGLELAVAERPSGKPIYLRVSPHSDLPPEAYRLAVTPDSVVLDGNSTAGLFYAVQTLRQLLPPDGILPALAIEDEPRFQWRGMHLDVGRHFFPVSFIKRYIDLIARYKLNTFHWHLTEDQGWRIEIKAFPRLTSIGSCRRETVLERNLDPYIGDGTPHCGFYTQDEIREVVRYAAERYVAVVPEIEMPGHSVAALAAYPELACTPGPFEVHTSWGVTEDIYCPSDTTFAFLEQVLEEVMDLFPSKFIHVGGDEAPKRRWQDSPLAQEIIHREGLTDEAHLQHWFIQRIGDLLTRRGRRMIGWDEIMEGGTPREAAIMSWRGIDPGLQAAREGHDVVMTPTSHLYFDYYQGNPEYEPLAIGGFLPLEQVYAFEPVPPDLPPDAESHILGAQANVWTEYISTPDQVEYMVLPRMLALAEVVWSSTSRRSWSRFLARLPDRLAALDRDGYRYRLPEVDGLSEDQLTVQEQWTLTLRTGTPDATIRYTMDGSDPSTTSTTYRGPLSLALDTIGTVITARAFTPDGLSSAPRSARFRRTSLRPPEPMQPGELKPGLDVTVYRGRIDSLRGLDTLATTGQGSATDLAIPLDSPAEGFALVFTGFLEIPEDGIWRLRLTSDDGSDLWIGGQPIVVNDGLHGMREISGSVGLSAGLHPLRVRYFQAGGGRGLSLTIELADGSGPGPVEPRLWKR